MLGDIDDLEVKPSTNRGMTPRIFEFLFARIRAVIIIVFTFLFGFRAHFLKLFFLYKQLT